VPHKSTRSPESSQTAGQASFRISATPTQLRYAKATRSIAHRELRVDDTFIFSSQDRDEVRARLAFLSARLSSSRGEVNLQHARNFCCTSAASTCLPKLLSILPTLSKPHWTNQMVRKAQGFGNLLEDQHAVFSRVGNDTNPLMCSRTDTI